MVVQVDAIQEALCRYRHDVTLPNDVMHPADTVAEKRQGVLMGIDPANGQESANESCLRG